MHYNWQQFGWRKVEEADFVEFLKGSADYLKDYYGNVTLVKWRHNGQQFAAITSEGVFVDPALLTDPTR